MNALAAEPANRGGSVGRFVAVFVGYVLAVTLAGALLAWPLWLLLGVFGAGADSFHKLTLRSVQLAAVLGLWPLASALGLTARADYALRRGPGFLRELGNGVLLGVAGLLVLALALLLSGARVPRETLDLAPLRVLLFLLVALVGALLLALVEEIWFRGGLYGAARRYLGVVGAAVSISALFAIVHYARTDMPIAAADVRWWSGLQVMRHAFDRLFTHDQVLDSLVALFLLGVMLVALRERSGRLALPIGVHAGSVAVVRLLREYTEVSPDPSTAWLVGGYDGVMGWVAALWMCVLITVIVRSRQLPGVVGEHIAMNDREHALLEVDPAVYRWSVRLFSLARRMLGVNVRLHGDDDDINAGDIFLFNHFARFETFIPQYLIYERTGAYCRSVASPEFFGDTDEGFTAYLRNLGAVPNDMPDLLPFLAAEILRGRKVVIFPEGGMVKDRRVLDRGGRFSVFSRSADVRRKHHSGAAYLALALDAFKESVRLAERDGHGERLEALARVLRMPDAHALLAAVRRPTRIVPANITFYPIRVDDNLLRRGADLLSRGLSRRVSEELLIEGNLLLKHTDMDIRLGEPVPASSYWRWWEQKLLRFALRKAGSLEDYYGLRGGQGSPAQRLMAAVMRHHAERVRDDCMQRMYAAVSVNLSHLASTLMLRLLGGGTTELPLEEFQLLLYLAVKRTQREPSVHLHRSLRNPEAYDNLPDGSCAALDQLLSTARPMGLVDDGHSEDRPRTLRLLPKLLVEHEFDSVRLENLIDVYANEVAPVDGVREAVEQALREAVAPATDHVSGLRFDDEMIAYAWDREHCAGPADNDLSVPETATESGEPFLLLPESRRERGIVLVHGFLASPAEVRAFGETLAGLGYPVIGVRLKGHGTTPWDLRERNWRDWLASVQRGIAIMSGYTSHVALVGFSTGGALALLAAAARPGGIDAVAAVSAPIKFRNRNLVFVPLVHGANRLVRWMSSLEGVYPFRANDSEHPTINYHHIPIRGLYELTRMVADLKSALPAVRCPVLVLQGDADPVVNAKSAAKLVARLSGAPHELQMVRSDRHGILYENIDGTQQRIVDFLERLADNGATSRSSV